MLALLTKSKCKVTYTQVTVKAHVPFVPIFFTSKTQTSVFLYFSTELETPCSNVPFSPLYSIKSSGLNIFNFRNHNISVQKGNTL